MPSHLPADRSSRVTNDTTGYSPVWSAVWDRAAPASLFCSHPPQEAVDVTRVMDASLRIVRQHRDAGTLHDSREKVATQVLDDLARAGYWGLRVASHHGGCDASLRDFYPFLTRMATCSATIAGLASVHGCIGAAGAVSAFGTDDQKQRWLPALARGDLHTCFALTEPQAGSDLTAVATRAERTTGGNLRVSGEKMFISNLALGRLVVLICRLDGEPVALVGQLPTEESAEFQLRHYGLHALRRSWNRGMVLSGWEVPEENLLRPSRGNGLTIAYHGLNRGRVAVCAVAAGQLRSMLLGLIPWVQERVTYGEPLARRELIRRRVARLAALAFGADALVAWCGSLLDDGVRGELECTIAKVFGSEALKEAALELVMKTHGGRSFLRGHPWGDNLYDYLTPCIYEGEGEILSLAMFRGLARPPADGLPADRLSAHRVHSEGGQGRGTFASWSGFAEEQLGLLADEIRQALREHGAALSAQQCLMVELSQRAQKLVALRVVAEAGEREGGECRRLAAEQLAADLHRELSGQRPLSTDFRRSNRLGEMLLDGGYREWMDECPA